MKHSNLSTRLASRVTDVWGGIVVNILAKPGVEVIEEEGSVDAKSTGWDPAFVEATGG